MLLRAYYASLAKVTEDYAHARLHGETEDLHRADQHLEDLLRDLNSHAAFTGKTNYELSESESAIVSGMRILALETERIRLDSPLSDIRGYVSLSSQLKGQFEQISVQYRLRPLTSFTVMHREAMQESSGFLALGLFLIAACVAFVYRSVNESLKRSEIQADELARTNAEVQQARAELELSLNELKIKQTELERNRGELQDALDHAENQKAMHDHASRRFQSLFAGLPVGCMTFDSAGTVMEWNPQMSEIFETEGHYATLNPVTKALKAVDRGGEIQSYIDTVAVKGLPVEFDWTIEASSGKRVVSMAWFPLNDPNGNAVGGIGCAVDVTSQRRAESENREMAEFQVAVLDSADYSIITCSPDGTVTGFNRAAEKQFLYSGDVIVNVRNIMDLIPETEIALQQAEIEAEFDVFVEGVEIFWYAAERSETRELEWMCRRADGTGFDARLSVTPLRTRDGEVHGYVVVGKDITQEKETRERLRMLSMVAREAANAVLICDASSAIIYTNPAFETMSGWSQFEVVGQSPFTILFGEDTALETRKQMFDAVKSKTPIHTDILQYNRSGETYWVRSSMSPVFNEAGVCTNLVWIQEDVTSRKVAEAELAAANERVSQTLESIQDNFFSISDDGLFRFVNRSAAEVIGVPGEALAGKPVWEFCPGIDWKPVWELVETTKESGEITAGEFLFLGLATYFEFRLYPSEGGVSVFFQDVTERKNFQRKLEDKNAELEEAKLQLEMNERQLKEANKQLRSLASTDGLTGLKNHKTFQEFLQEQFEYAREEKTPLTVVLMDVDKFKPYNDQFGHPAGDQVLKGVANCLRNVVKAPHMVARYGGEEFVMVLVGLDEVEALCVVEEARYELEGRTWPHREITASMGVAFMKPTTRDRQELIESADKALYVSKESGRNRVTAWDWVLARENRGEPDVA